MNRYDIVIIGSGMGGLVCGAILSKEGYRVCILEKNKQIGGSLQVFSREKVIFDSGVHYIGGLEKGQNLYQIFKYLGVMDSLKLQRMDMDAFDKIIISNDEKEYKLAQGYENFIHQLAADFPGEEEAIRNYCNKMRETCESFPLYNLKTKGLYDGKSESLGEDARSVITSFTQNEKLQSVLAGHNALYAGRPNETPFYMHALIVNSFIESSWKCVNGGSQIGKMLAKTIRDHGGEIIKHCEVKKIVTKGSEVSHVESTDGACYYGAHFISNIHPARTLEMTDTETLRAVYRKRINDLSQTISSFLIHVVLKKGCFKYFRHNYYYHKDGQIWNLGEYSEDNWPLGYAIFLPPSSRTTEYADAMTILAYMRYEEMEPWKHTFNTISAEQSRGTSYDTFKKHKAEVLLDCVEEKFPDLRSCIQSYTTSTPLSYRDYIGNYDGSLYGIAKDHKDPLRTFISPRTKVRNLYLTGQNVNIHGVLGASISAILTCVSLLGSEAIVEKIRNA